MKFINVINKIMYTYEEDHKYYLGTKNGKFKKRISEKDNLNLISNED